MSKTPLILSLIFVLILGAGCGDFNILSKEPETPQPPQAAYYNFNDILVPPELNLDGSRSSVVGVNDLVAGRLFYTGYVEVDSLTDFFSKSMPSQGWSLKSMFSSAKMVMLFEKNEKICIIEISEAPILTEVEIWVAPTV